MKAVAVPYVIALVLGIVVIGLVGYWFISQGGKTITAGTKAECDAMKFSYCNGFRGWDTSCDPEPSNKNSFCGTQQSNQRQSICDTGFCTFTSPRCSTGETDCGESSFDVPPSSNVPLGTKARKCCKPK